MEIALDGIHYLIGLTPFEINHVFMHFLIYDFMFLNLEHGYLRGKRKIPPDGVESVSNKTDPTYSSREDDDYGDKINTRRNLMDLIIETVNRCSEEFDDGVQVQVGE